VSCRIFSAHVLWYLGYPDQALESMRRALTLAQELSHPYSLANVLDFSAWLHVYRREASSAQERAEVALACATEHGFALFVAHVTNLQGWALLEQGEVEQGIAQLRQGLAAYRATGAEVERPYFLGLLAAAYGKVGQTEAGLQGLAQALAAVDKTGMRFCEAELYRLKGELLMDRANKRYFALAAPSSASSGVRQRSPLEDPPHLGRARAVSAARQHVRARTCARTGAVERASRRCWTHDTERGSVGPPRGIWQEDLRKHVLGGAWSRKSSALWMIGAASLTTIYSRWT
jgi:predicted ATPase